MKTCRLYGKAVSHEAALKRYGRWLYAIYQPGDDREGTLAAVTAVLDIMFEERGQTPLKEFEADANAIESAGFEHLMPVTTRSKVAELLKTRLRHHSRAAGNGQQRHRCLVSPMADLFRTPEHPSHQRTPLPGAAKLGHAWLFVVQETQKHRILQKQSRLTAAYNGLPSARWTPATWPAGFSIQG